MTQPSDTIVEPARPMVKEELEEALKLCSKAKTILANHLTAPIPEESSHRRSRIMRLRLRAIDAADACEVLILQLQSNKPWLG